jgi:hypothetical protein
METDLGNKTIGLKRDADLHGFILVGHKYLTVWIKYKCRVGRMNMATVTKKIRNDSLINKVMFIIPTLIP